MKWHFEITENWDTIRSETYQNRWSQFMNEVGDAHVFFHPAIVRAWVDTYLPLRKITPLFVWAKSADNEVFFPLVLWHRNWKNAFLRTIVPVGFSDFDYHDPIARKPLQCSGFFSELLQELQSCNYDRIIFDGIHCEKDTNIIEQPFKTVQKEVCPYINISYYSDYKNFEESLKPKVIKEIKRHENRLFEMGQVRCLEYEKTEVKEALTVLPSMLEMHQQKYPKAYKAPDFHRNLVQRGLESGLLFFSQMSLNGTAISWNLCFNYRDTLSLYMPVSGTSYRNCSVGKIHLLHCIEQAFVLGKSKFDFLRGDEEYKKLWTTQESSICTLEHRQSLWPAKLRNGLYDFRYKTIK